MRCLVKGKKKEKERKGDLAKNLFWNTEKRGRGGIDYMFGGGHLFREKKGKRA